MTPEERQAAWAVHRRYRESARASPPASPPRPAAGLSDARKAMRLGKLACLYAGPPACGCTGSHRCYALGRDATLRDCMACLKEMS